MQSQTADGYRLPGCLAVVSGALPVVGLAVEILGTHAKGVLDQRSADEGDVPVAAFGTFPTFSNDVWPLFPTAWHLVAVVAAAVLNLWLWASPGQVSRHLVLRVAVLSFVTGTSALYAFAMLPALPLILFTFMIGLGVLAAAPYWTLLGVTQLWPQHQRAWRQTGRSARTFWRLALLPAITAFGLGIAADAHVLMTGRWLERAAHGDGEAAANAARWLAWGDRETLREAAANGNWPGRRSSGVLCRGLELVFAAPRVSAESARAAVHRGLGWTEREWLPRVRSSGFGSRQHPRVRRSELVVTCDRKAAVALVDWTLAIENPERFAQEASLEFDLDADGVACGLWLRVGDEMQPATWAAVGKATIAYETVVATRRDPALLREIAPGRVSLRVFPVPGNGLGEALVRIALAVPARLDATGAALGLPRMRCGGETPDVQHVVEFEGADVPPIQVLRPQDLATMQVAFGEPAPVAAVRDDERILVQRIVPRPFAAVPQALVLVVDRSSSAVIDDGALCAELAAATAVRALHVILATPDGVRRWSGVATDGGLRPFLREHAPRGGVDVGPALRAALALARETDAGVVWLHGRQWGGQPADPMVAEARDLSRPLVAIDLGEGAGAGAEPNPVRERLAAAQAIATAPGGAEALVSLRRVLTGTAADRGSGDALSAFLRRFTDVDEVPTDAVAGPEALRAIAAAHLARAMREDRPEEAAAFACRHQIATAGAAGVVLETAADYRRFGLQPGSERAPGEPVPEPATWLLLASGLAVFGTRYRSRRRARQRSRSRADRVRAGRRG